MRFIFSGDVVDSRLNDLINLWKRLNKFQYSQWLITASISPFYF